VQSEFTLYVPVVTSGTMLPFMLRVAAPVLLPFPSKVSVPTPASGPAIAAGAVMNPVAMCEKVPLSNAFEHPLLLSALAMGAAPKAIAANAAIAKVFEVVRRSIVISLVFIN
jgi:hypothetical protein